MKQTEVLDKTVIGPDGNTVGIVREVAFSLEGELGFIVAPAKGEEVTIPFRRVLAVGEYILVSAPADAPAPLNVPVDAPAARTAPAPAPAPSARAGGAVAGNACPKCAKPVQAGMRFCVGCGTKLEVA